ncbi:MAG: hypothetical protein FRX48_04310 [Lasallia pustulata]|uniref:Uncharacterized protein n=1 Tax=Lasallia pustulata TaxID=136370 RepID=A0A5M8PRK4_9LECA|nr:MAG: hypothetical protein FRX48_04310 [Lasallia pustulata]
MPVFLSLAFIVTPIRHQRPRCRRPRCQRRQRLAIILRRIVPQRRQRRARQNPARLLPRSPLIPRPILNQMPLLPTLHLRRLSANHRARPRIPHLIRGLIPLQPKPAIDPLPLPRLRIPPLNLPDKLPRQRPPHRLRRLLLYLPRLALLRHRIRIHRRPAHVQNLAMVQALMRHRLLGELAVRLVHVGDEGDAARRQHADAVDLAPLGEVAGDDLFDVVGHVDTPHVQRAGLAHEAADAAHVVAVVAVLVAAEAVDVGVEEVVDPGEPVQVFALVAFGAQASGEEEAEVRAGDCVGAGVARVGGDGAAAGRGGLREVFVFAVAAGPFVVPDVEDGAGLGGGSDFRVEGSTWGRAGRRLRRMIFLVFLTSGASVVVRAVVVMLATVRSVLGDWGAGESVGSGVSSVDGILGGIEEPTSAIMDGGGGNIESEVGDGSGILSLRRQGRLGLMASVQGEPTVVQPCHAARPPLSGIVSPSIVYTNFLLQHFCFAVKPSSFLLV